MVQPVAQSSLVPERIAKRYRIREIRDGDRWLEHMPTPGPVLAQRYSQGAICLGAFRDEDFIGYIWLCFDQYDEDEVRCLFLPLPPHRTAFDFDIFLFPSKRLGIGFGILWDAANRFLSERGIRHTASRISRFNVSSKRSHTRLGSERIGTAAFLTGHRFQLMLATVRPYLHVSRSPNRRPCIELRPRQDEATPPR